MVRQPSRRLVRGMRGGQVVVIMSFVEVVRLPLIHAIRAKHMLASIHAINTKLEHHKYILSSNKSVFQITHVIGLLPQQIRYQKAKRQNIDVMQTNISSRDRRNLQSILTENSCTDREAFQLKNYNRRQQCRTHHPSSVAGTCLPLGAEYQSVPGTCLPLDAAHERFGTKNILFGT